MNPSSDIAELGKLRFSAEYVEKPEKTFQKVQQTGCAMAERVQNARSHGLGIHFWSRGFWPASAGLFYRSSPG
tara:strand:- start:198 stop:416 length:219 start_codon:yes stop_codon:yes gene_type:complete